MMMMMMMMIDDDDGVDEDDDDDDDGDDDDDEVVDVVGHGGIEKTMASPDPRGGRRSWPSDKRTTVRVKWVKRGELGEWEYVSESQDMSCDVEGTS